jgi:hypothetical protein
MKTRYVVLEREYGSGATRLARQAAMQAGVPCFGTEILEAAGKETGVSTDNIETYEEKATNSFLYSLYVFANQGGDMLTQEGKVFVAEQKAIRHMADQNRRALFIGHCAVEALKDREGVCRVFVSCRNNVKKRGIIAKEYGIAQDEIERTRQHFDRKRARYYEANTGKKWNDPANYDLMLDTGNLDDRVCVSILRSLFEKE